MKKHIRLATSFVLLSMSFTTVACTKGSDGHEHSWKSNWQSDEEFHWKECNDCLDLGLRGRHISSETGGNVCFVCGYSKNNAGNNGESNNNQSGNAGGNESGENGGTSGSNGQTPEVDPKWNLDFTKFGVDFRDTLASLIEAKVTKTTTYSACLAIGKEAAKKGDGKFVPFYHGSDYAVSTSAGSNREHTWPNSRGGGDKAGGDNIESDPFMVRPTITADNSDRANYFYGTSGKSGNEWDPASCGFEAARGESARVIFYVATRYGKSNGLSLSNNPADASNKRTMGTLSRLVEWNKKYPVTDMEIQINEYLNEQGYGRNPFVDHPEYVDYIWNENGLVNSLPNGSSIIGGSSSGSSSNNAYTAINSIDEIDNKDLYIVNYNTKYTAMTNTNYSNSSTTYAWYFNGVDATVSSDKKSMSCSGASMFKFSKQSDGSFTIMDGDKNLYSYVEGTHYSISIAKESSITNGNIYWNITKSEDGYIIKGKTTEVYLQYNKSWCGKNTAPEKPLYLYK